MKLTVHRYDYGYVLVVATRIGNWRHAVRFQANRFSGRPRFSMTRRIQAYRALKEAYRKHLQRRQK